MTSFPSPSDRAGRGGPGLAVIDTPAAPPGWEDARSRLIRIVDPLGHAVAWLAPAHGGRCVGFAVRPSGAPGTAWVQVLHVVAPAASREGTPGAGCGVQCVLAAQAPGGALKPGQEWRFVERDPTAATLAATCAGDGIGAAGERLGGLNLRFSAALAGGTLTFTLLAENSTTEPLQLCLGLELTLAGSLLSDAAGSIRVDLPGNPIRQSCGDTRVGLPPGAAATLGGSDTPLTVEVALIDGASRLRYLAPMGERGAVGLSASAGDEPGGAVTVEAGKAFHLAVALRAALSAPGSPG